MQNMLGGRVRAFFRFLCLTVLMGLAAMAQAAGGEDLAVVQITPVSRSAASAGQYDYRYNVTLRNGGVGAYDVQAVLSSSDNRYSVRDGRLGLDLLPAGASTLSPDTITVRAPLAFDTRFNTRGQPVAAAASAAGPAIESGAFSWKITARRDGAVPTITDVQPSGTVPTSRRRLSISARYSDDGVGIDRASVRLMVDGRDLTRRADVSGGKIDYDLDAPAAGSHSVKLQVADKLGNKAEREWSFTYGASTPAGTGTLSLPQLLVVDYQPVSKVLVAGTSGAGAQYLYSYRVSVRNSGVAASDVTGKLTSKRSRVVVTDADVSFGAVGARQTKASTDTFTVRAGRFFDRRLDHKITRNGRLVYDPEGDDDDDKGQRGLGLSHAGWAAAAIDTWYFLKFSLIFDWKLQSRASDGAPVITSTSPTGNVTTTQPVIEAAYRDDTGVATAQVRLLLDGADVTSASTVSASGIRFTGNALAQGAHAVVLTVPDTAGNRTTATWAFHVDSIAPTITTQFPRDTQSAAPGAVISAQFNDSGAGIDIGRLRLLVDGVDVTERATLSAEGISYQPPSPLAGGAHSVSLSVADIAGNVAVSSWTFGVDAAAPVVSGLQPASGAEIAADAIPTVAASYADGGAGIDTSKVKLLVDGLDVTAQAQISATGISWRPPAPLAEGSHQVRLTVVKRNGVSSNTSWSFVSRTAPVITAASPRDQVLGAGSNVVITAQYGDVGAGVDTARVTLLLDGVDVTAQAQISETGLSLTPQAPLPQGVHIFVLTVTDKAGNATAGSWRFTLDTGLPSISDEQPKNTLLNSGTPTISARFQDSGDSATGIDAARLKLWVNDLDVTAQAQVDTAAAPGRVSYTPASPLPPGNQSVRLVVADKAGNQVESAWSFSVDAAGPRISNLSPVDGAIVAANTTLTFKADFTDEGSGIDLSSVALEIDGQAVASTLWTADANGLRYMASPAVGTHSYRVSVKDRAGNAASGGATFTAVSAPRVSGLSPADGTVLPVGATVDIGATLGDAGGGIDMASIRLSVDGVDVTGSATLTASSVLLLVPTPYAVGRHAVQLVVRDGAGNQTTTAWSFEIDAPAATVFSNLAPRATLPQTAARPRISADYADASGINLSQVRLVMDEVDVTQQASITASGVSFTPAQALAPGRHVVYLVVTNNQGRVASTIWTFEVEASGAYSVQFTEPAASTAVDRTDLKVTVRAGSDKHDVAGIQVNGFELVRQSVSGRDALYSGMVQVAPGDTVLRAIASYSDGQTRLAVMTVGYYPPPKISIVSPLDKTILGPVNPNSPRDLTGNVERPVTITGLMDRAVASVTINQQQATLTDGGLGFRFDNFFLHEGNNFITAVATDAQGRVGNASVIVSVDQTAPLLGVEAPANNSVTSGNSIDVRGTVNDAVAGYYGAAQPVVTITGPGGRVVAQVNDKQFLAVGVPLQIGENQLTVVATDEAGNARSIPFKVIRTAGATERLVAQSGHLQTATVTQALARPLVAGAYAADGQPLANTPVTFEVVRGTGYLSSNQAQAQAALSSQSQPVRRLSATTDANGLAQVWLTLGKQSGPGSDAVKASAPNIAEEVVFIASAAKAPARFIRSDLGINQYVATSSQPLEPLTAVVVDGYENRLAGANVTFRVVVGDARFDNGTSTIIVTTDNQGMAAVRPVAGATAGEIMVHATVEGVTDDEAVFTLQALRATDGATQFSGTLQNDRGEPLPGARMSIGRTNLSVATDAQGRFLFDDVPPGKIDLFVDGRTVNLPGVQYPALHFEATAVKGAANQLPHPIYLPQLQMSEARVVGGNEDVVLRMPGIEGYEMKIFANSVTFPDGSKQGQVVVSPIAQDKLPMTPPGGYAGFMAPAATIQPSGTRFDPPAQLKLPNTAGFAPGEKRPVYQWDHDLATFVQMGQATVTDDGLFLITDAGTGISKAGWHPIPNPPPPDDCPKGGSTPNCPQCQELAQSGGKCPKPYCKRLDGGSCDDGKYCTKNDECKGGSCKGTPVEDINGGENVLEVNFQTFNHVFSILSKLGLSTRIDSLKGSWAAQEKQICCESKQGEMTKGGQHKIEAKASVGIGPVIVGPKFAFPSAVPGKLAEAGVAAVSAEIGGALNASAKYALCEGYEACWGGGGNIYLEATGEVGLVIKDGPVVAFKATGAIKSAYKAGIEVACDKAMAQGIFWDGIKGVLTLEWSDGRVHWERNWEIVPGAHLAPFEIPLPSIGG